MPRRPFRDRLPEDYPMPALNPYLKLHREVGLPVITGDQAPTFKDDWNRAFGRVAPLQLEIGTGNGSFLATMAERHPEANWLGVEIRFKRVVQGARCIMARRVTNARITRYDAFFLGDLFGPGSLRAIHLNHPDPWPKGRHEKNRLIGEGFLAWAHGALEVDGVLRLKTDSRDHVERLDAIVQGDAWEILGRSDDVRLHGAPWSDDVVTGYQAKFDKAGTPVYAVLLRRR